MDPALQPADPIVTPPVTVKGREYWESMAEKFSIPLYNTARTHKHYTLVYWEKYPDPENKANMKWRVGFSEKFQIWAKENLRGEYRAQRMLVSPDLVRDGREILAAKNKFLSSKGKQRMTEISIFSMVFENAVDAVHFKMRWL